MQLLFKPEAILSKKEENGKIHILLGTYSIITYRKDDPASHRYAMVQLLHMGISSRQLEKIFGTNRHQIQYYNHVFDEEGIVGLVNLKRVRSEGLSQNYLPI